MVDDTVCRKEGCGGASKFPPVISAHVGRCAKRAKQAFLQHSSHGGGGTVRDELQNAEFAVAAYGG